MSKSILMMVMALGLSAAATRAGAQTQEEMQKSLNAEVARSAFNPGDIKKAEAAAEKSLRDGVIPQAQAPSYWAPGWTCGNMISYQYYNYGDYSNCVYYHHYYHRYWY